MIIHISYTFKKKEDTYSNIFWQYSAEITFISACWSIDGLSAFLNMVLPQPVTYPVVMAIQVMEFWIGGYTKLAFDFNHLIIKIIPNFWRLCTKLHNSQNSINSFGYVEFSAKNFLILYPRTWKSITCIAIPVVSCNSSCLLGKQTGWICFLKVTGRSNLIRAISLLKFFGWKSLFTLISSMSKSSCSNGSILALAFQSPRDHPYIMSEKGLDGWVW